MGAITTGIKKLRKIQMAPETTAGTAVAPDYVWRGEGTLEDQSNIVEVPEDVGRMMGYDRRMKTSEKCEIVFGETPATFEQLPFILGSGIEWEAGAQDGTGDQTGYVRTYNFPTTASLATKTFTIQGGDNIKAEKSDYFFVKEFSLSGAVDDAVWIVESTIGQFYFRKGDILTLTFDDPEDVVVTFSAKYQ